MPSADATDRSPIPGSAADADDLMAALPSAIVEPRIESRPSYLDTDRVHTSEDFELLLAHIASEVHGLTHVKFFGTRGQRQHGIDLVGVASDNTIWALQAKRYQTFEPADLRAAVAKFANADRQDDGSRILGATTLVVAAACDARSTSVVATFFALREEAMAADQPFDLHFWDRHELSQQLKSKPQIVRRVFGEYTASRFCDSHVGLPAGEGAEPGSSGSQSRDPETDDSVRSSSPPSVLTDIVMVGPERASGADTVLSDARDAVAGDPARAAELFRTAEGLLANRGFVLQAAIVSEARAQALVQSGQFAAAAEVLLTRFWSALDGGSHFDYRRVGHDLNKIAQANKSDSQAASAAATADAASKILRNADRGLAAAGELLSESPTSLGAVQLARLACETASAAGRWPWLTRHSATVQAAAANAETVGLFDDGLRIALCIADATDVWNALLDRAELTKNPMFSAVIQARYARRCAYRQESTTARQMWMSAAATAAERGWNSDASEWLFAVSKLRMRFTPLDPAEDQARNSARALRSASGPTRVYSASYNSREAGLDASQAGRGTDAIDNLQDYLRSSFASGRWVDEDDARTLLSSAFACDHLTWPQLGRRSARILAPPGVVIIPPGWVRCVVTNVGPTLVQIVPSGCRRGGRSGAVEGGVVRADQAGPAA